MKIKMASLGRKASEAAAAAAAMANPFTRRISEAIANAKDPNKGSSGLRGRNKGSGGEGNGDGETRCTDPGAPFGFLDTMCGPMLRNFNGGDTMGSNDADDLAESNRGRSGQRGVGAAGANGASGSSAGERGGRGRQNSSSSGQGGRRPTGSYDYDDETNATDMTGSYEEDDETYDDDSRRKGRGEKRARGRDRKPRGRSPADSPSEMTGMTGASAFSEFDDDTTQNDTVTDASSSAYDKRDRDSSKKDSSNNNNNNNKSSSNNKSSNQQKNQSQEDDTTKNTTESEKLITQPLASGFAKRCYFTKAGIGRTTQHYEGLTLTGNTVLMLAAAMKLKGCPTICDEDLRRVEQTYPNQFSRLPDELLLSSGWRRISKYCHFSYKPLPDGVPFFHSRKRCHPNGGFYFLLCSAVGMTRLMDVEPLNRDALAVLQTDFPMTCEKAPDSLTEDPSEWTLVNKFCFFSGGPINVEEDVYYRAELGGTEIYMLAFLSPSLSPEELYRLKAPGGKGSASASMGSDTSPLKSVAAVEEVESVYDLTERDFDDLKLYHLGPCRALPPYLLHPETWTKVLPPHFVAAREEALRIAQEWESRYPPSASQSVVQGNNSQLGSAQDSGASQGMMGESPGSSGYVELGGGGGRPPQSARSGMPPVGGPGYPPQYPGHGMHTPMSQDPNAQYYPPEQQQGGYPPQHMQQQQYGAPPTSVESEMNYYYGQQPSGAVSLPPGAMTPGSVAHSQFQHSMPPPSSTNPYGNPDVGAPSPDRMSQNPMNQMGGQSPYDAGPHDPQMYGNAPPQHMMGDPHWRDVREEGAFGMMAGDQPHDEAMYGPMNGMSPGVGGGNGNIDMDMDMNNMGYPPMAPGPMDPDEQQGEYEQQDDYDYEHQDEYEQEDDFGRHREDPPDTDHRTAIDDGNKSVASVGSSLMGGAQTRLKRNRMKKMKERTQRPDLSTKLGGGPNNKNNMSMPGTVGDDSTWDTRTDGESSYGTSLVSGSSYTDTTNPNERNSRRALILQMAKARMKNVKEPPVAKKQNADSVGEQGGQQASNDDTGLEGQGDEFVDDVAGLELD